MSLTKSTATPPREGEEDISDLYPEDRGWVTECLSRLRDQRLQPKKTRLIEFPLPAALDGMKLFVKNESAQPSGSHKHRLAHALFTNALASGCLRDGTPVFEASSGSTAISEAWYSNELGIKFNAVMPSGTSEEKQQAVRDLKGNVILATAGEDLVTVARRQAEQSNGHFMDQFTYAERAYDWRSEHGLAPELCREVEPDWFVMGAGTGGTVTSVGRYARYTNRKLRVCATDPENSAFLPGWRDHDRTATDKGSRIEGIGRPRMEPSFLFPLVNRMIRVHDAASVATMRVAAQYLGIEPGPSTGTGLFGAVQILLGMQANRQRGTIATVLCDAGSRYTAEYYNDDWLDKKGIDYRAWMEPVERFFKSGEWQPPVNFSPAPRPSATLWNM
ncbi:PLP-dependent cysteine synthase family protein [Kitasatospora sp. NBC_01266]|uniref:PLP-dependent cysteine synthase family protein n=1 Tax=Kitasatospora sp. NBC_01266 TaxID=2903572 RepID=UPI002E3219C7|nr:PLP-dependent cysteine synthase family protein [Kitasatospora sp. NBC_01266]